MAAPSLEADGKHLATDVVSTGAVLLGVLLAVATGYTQLDAILAAYVEEDKSPADIIASGISKEAVEQVVRLIRINEYKRRQSPVGVRVTHRAFGRDWRYPIVNKFRE